jgi:trk system potassium uptake protein TrkH
MRYRAYLRARYRGLCGYLSVILALIGLSILSPLPLLAFYPEEWPFADGFLLAGLPLLIGGWLLRRLIRTPEGFDLSIQEGMVLTVLAWGVSVSMGGLPFVLEDKLNFHQAVFEATSGWTSTGLTVVDITNTPKLVLFYRSTTQLIGGAGFSIIILSAITGALGRGLNDAEGRDDKLAPHIRQSSQIVLALYLSYIAIGAPLLWLAGMPPFDALNHAITAVATGGFSTHAESAGFWDSFLIEALLVSLMLLGSFNFMAAYLLMRGNWRAFLRHTETRMTFFIVPLGVLLLFFTTTLPLYDAPAKALRVALFEAVSNLTTGGFQTVAYAPWADVGWLVLMVLMIFGGSTGSTAAGIKLLRVAILLQAFVWEVRRAFLPTHMVNAPSVWRGNRRVFLSDFQVRQVGVFVISYLSLMALAAGVVLAHGYPLRDVLYEVTSAMGGVGSSSGLTSPEMPLGVLYTLVGTMLLGRLEIFALFIGVVKLGDDVRVLAGFAR